MAVFAKLERNGGGVVSVDEKHYRACPVEQGHVHVDPFHLGYRPLAGQSHDATPLLDKIVERLEGPPLMSGRLRSYKHDNVMGAKPWGRYVLTTLWRCSSSFRPPCRMERCP